MAYDPIEVSPEGGRPIELYEFQRDGVYYRFTSADVDIIKDSETFTSIAIERSSINQSDEFEKSGIKVEFARDESFASAFLAYSPDFPTILTIFRFHYTDTEFIVYWKGRVAAASASGSQISLECESVFSSLKRQGLRQTFEVMCRHILYDVNCGVDQNEFKIPSVAYNVDGSSFDFAIVTGADNPHLMAYYSGENLSGTVLTDDSGNGFTGTATDVTQSASFIGLGLLFNGTTSKVSTTITLPATGDFSLSFSVKSADTDGALLSNDSGQAGGFPVTIGAGGFISIQFETMTLTSTTAVTDLDDFIVYVDRTGSDFRLGINGTIEDTGTESSAISNAVFYIGSHPNNTSFFAGTLDQIRFMNAIQTADAISFFATEDTNKQPLPDWFQAGMAEVSNGSKRFIKIQSSSTLSISYPFESLSENESLNLFAGCQHRPQTDCLTKFNNLDNNGGYPYFPTDSGPFDGRSIA